MESIIPGAGSSAAANHGTAAHELAAWALTMRRDPADMLGRVIDIEGANHHTRFLLPGAPLTETNTRWPVDSEMVDAVTVYADFVKAQMQGGGQWAIEERLSVEAIHPEMWGTGDAIVVHPETRTLHIIDLKYGRGVKVDAKDNPQLLAYASGAVSRFHNVCDVETVRMSIVQPRTENPIRTWEIGIAELREHEARMSAAAARAMEATERHFPSPRTPALQSAMTAWEAQYLSAGEHCRFCRAGATCPARRQQAMDLAQAEFSDTGDITLPEVETMAPELLGQTLRNARMIQHWVNAVEEFAHAEATAGRVPPGFKMVAKRATRSWKDEESLVAAAPLLLSVALTDMYEPPKLLSPAKLEKLLPKSERETLAAFVTTTSSGTNLVPVEDARSDVRPSAESEFSS